MDPGSDIDTEDLFGFTAGSDVGNPGELEEGRALDERAGSPYSAACCRGAWAMPWAPAATALTML
jgi:hypothetical protein